MCATWRRSWCDGDYQVRGNADALFAALAAQHEAVESLHAGRR
jgi:hypothetical protein